MFLKKAILSLSLLVVLLSSCTEYQKVLKSTDTEYKYRKAKEYYAAEKYYKAYPLLEELVTLYRGTQRAEELYYMWAYCDYFSNDLLLASHRFTQFTKTFPTSDKNEECKFMSAYCQYLLSPTYRLEQTSTVQAIDELQLYLTEYPNSKKHDTINILIDELEGKLERKSFESGKLYLKTQHYNAAVITFNNSLNDFPDTEYREEIFYLIFKSHYELSLKSVETKQLSRIEEGMKAYRTFVDKYPNSKYLRSAENMYEELSALKIERLEAQEEEKSKAEKNS
ncbi:MAG: outer membrane protein assembly factor BamD [Crocinitomicaceae bacterium]|nr:outer membrane protein assembly factor BamD [Crocinitomicaceae bacterium]|tara:strand:+ start:923 stop:1765 length:843 start_codon:yes stop_codon:yes gene_type:complete